jgi:transposase
MGTHANAPLSIEGRRRLVERCQSRPIAHVAAEMGISRACASKWVNRYRRHGELGLHDRSSTPRHQPTATPGEVVEQIEQMRRNHKWSAGRIAFELSQTVHAVSRRTITRHLAHLGLSRRRFIDPDGHTTRKPRTITARRPGHLVHIDVKKVGRIPDDGGWRAHGRNSGHSRAVSRNTLLGLITSLPDPPVATPRVVGVDEYAQRKGRIYGTVLVDVETRRPVDLLPDREADTLAAWLSERPEIEIICRDRALFYAEGATRGAPQALQVADRWHLWHNLGEAAEKCVYRHRACLRPAPEPPEEPHQAPESPASSPWPTGHRFAERTRAKHATVHALLAAGHSKRSIARQLGMGLNTVLRFSRATEPERLFTGQWQCRPTKLDAYKPYLDQRWQEGCTNAWKLWEEIKAQGYPDGYGNVRAYVSRNLRGKPQPVGPRPPSTRAVSR